MLDTRSFNEFQQSDTFLKLKLQSRLFIFHITIKESLRVFPVKKSGGQQKRAKLSSTFYVPTC